MTAVIESIPPRRSCSELSMLPLLPIDSLFRPAARQAPDMPTIGRQAHDVNSPAFEVLSFRGPNRGPPSVPFVDKEGVHEKAYACFGRVDGRSAGVYDRCICSDIKPCQRRQPDRQYSAEPSERAGRCPGCELAECPRARVERLGP